MAGYDIGDALHRIELLLLQSMRRNLHRHLTDERDEGIRWSMWQAEQITTLGNWTRRNYRQYAPEFSRINQAAISLLQSSAARAQLVEEDLLLRTGIQRAGGFFVAPEEKLQSLLNAVRHDLSQAEHSILRQADDVYRRTLFDAQMYLQTGSGTLDNAIDMAVQDFMQRGIRSVVYRNGHRVEASTYARMALRSANVRAVMTGEGAARDWFGVHTVIVSPSGIACEKCAPWMGQILVDDVYCSGSREEAAELGVPLLSEAVSSGLLHPQCNCAVHTFQPGISKLPEVTDADREQAVNRYKLTQQQRYNERQIRKWKYAEDAAPDPAAQQAAHAKVRAWQQTNKALCDAHPAELRRDYQREKIWDAPRNPVVPGVIEKTPDSPLTAGAERGTIEPNRKMAAPLQTAPDFSKYPVSDNPEAVKEMRQTIINTLGIESDKVDLNGIRNAEVLEPFVKRLQKIKADTGMGFPPIRAVEVIEGDPTCIADFKPFEKVLYISSMYFNSKDALLDTLKDWTGKGILPKQAKSIAYLAEHETAHIRIPDILLNSDEAKALFKKRKVTNLNDRDIFEYFADMLAIYRLSPNTKDSDIIKAVDYLRKGGVKI